MIDFSNIPSQFDNIVADHPVVFVSYSWDSKEHRKWVRKLADDLRAKYSVNVLLDQYNRGGLDLLNFMRKGIQIADRVLLIGTPIYKEKTLKYDGGAKYEDQLISTEIYHKMGTAKFIPVLREGKFDTSFSTLIEIRTGYSMVDDSLYDEILEQIAADLWNNPLNAAPALGPKPVFGNKPSSSITKGSILVEMTCEQFVSEVKRLLSMPNSEITLTDLIESEAKRAYDIIVANANYNFQIYSDSFKKYESIHYQAVEKLMASSIVVVRHGTKNQQQLYIDALVKLCRRPIVSGESYVTETILLHLLGATYLFHTIGVACIKFECYHILPILLKKIVPAPNVISSSNGLHLAFLTGIQHWEDYKINDFLRESWHYPYSFLVMKKLCPFFSESGALDEDFRNLYKTWEHILSLMFSFYKCHFIDREYYPHGSFVHARSTRLSHDYNFYDSFFNDALTEKNNWEPIKQGLFDGDYSNFHKEYESCERYFIAHSDY